MRSSGSTRKHRRDSAVRLLVVLTGEDHPKACTARRLLHWGRVEEVAREEGHFPGPVVLDPYAPAPLSAADDEAAGAGGLLVIDCSWNRLSSRGAFPGEEGRFRRHGVHRRLPLLIAANPQHYGRVAQLTSVEAFSAALYVLGRPAEAERVISGFAGGPDFLELNRTRFERYRAAPGPAEILAAEKELFANL